MKVSEHSLFPHLPQTKQQFADQNSWSNIVLGIIGEDKEMWKLLKYYIAIKVQ